MTHENMTPGDEAPPHEPAAGENKCEHCDGSGKHEEGGSVEEAVGGG
jgi:hypothetical protein